MLKGVNPSVFVCVLVRVDNGKPFGKDAPSLKNKEATLPPMTPFARVYMFFRLLRSLQSLDDSIHQCTLWGCSVDVEFVPWQGPCRALFLGPCFVSTELLKRPPFPSTNTHEH